MATALRNGSAAHTLRRAKVSAKLTSPGERVCTAMRATLASIASAIAVVGASLAFSCPACSAGQDGPSTPGVLSGTGATGGVSGSGGRDITATGGTEGPAEQLTGGGHASDETVAGSTGTSSGGSQSAPTEDASFGVDSGAPMEDASSGGVNGNAGTAGAPSVDSGTTPPAEEGAAADALAPPSRLPPVTTVETDGPFETTQDLATGPRGQSGLFYPTDLGRNGLKHPIFVWGCGGGSNPSSYAPRMNRIASHGFVVIAEVSTIGDNGAPLTAAIDWLFGENERPQSILFAKLDTASIAAGGHSIGSVNTFFIADDPRLSTTIHVAGGSLDDVNDPWSPTSGLGGMGLVHPAAYICGETDMFGNVEKLEQDYAATTAPVFFTIMTGADHMTAVAEGLAVIVAWLRWHLGGEDERRDMFLGSACDFCTGKYVSRSKNW